MQKKNQAWIWVGVVVVIIAVIAVFLWKPSSPPVAVGVPVDAPAGQLVIGFPQQLILDSNASINKSYSVNYSSSTNQYTAQINSSNSVASEFMSYQKYLQTNGWTIVNSSQSSSALQSIAATQGTSGLLIVISKDNQGSLVSINYATK